MKKYYRNGVLIILGIVCSGFLLSLHNTTDYENRPERLRDSQVPILRPTTSSKTQNNQKSAARNDKCLCVSQKTGKEYNFCYTDPQNSTSIGQKFDCESLKYLEILGIVGSEPSYVDLKKAERNEKDVVFAGAISDNHLNEGVASLNAMELFYPNQKFILYGLGLSEKNWEKITKFKNVELRHFNGSKYPDYATNWMEYRFKPLIVAEVLQEYSNVWWMDAHIRAKKADMTQALYEELVAEPNLKSSIVFFTFTGHSNYAVLLPRLLDYFPTNSIDLLKSQNGTQLGANTLYFGRTEFTMNIMKWWVLCALEKECMSPPGAKVYCHFGKNRYDYFAHCFRFDQSVMNLLLLNQYQDYHSFFSEKVSKFY